MFFRQRFAPLGMYNKAQNKQVFILKNVHYSNTAKNHAYELYMNMMNTFTSSNEPENEPLENKEFLSCHATSKNEALQIVNITTFIYFFKIQKKKKKIYFTV